jgi:hypothetical protein
MISRVLQKGSTWLINSSLVTIRLGRTRFAGAVDGGWADAAARHSVARSFSSNFSEQTRP